MENKIKANLIKHSESIYSNQPIYTFELDLPRIVLAELHTHRGEVIFNSQSSRAVPTKKYINNIRENPFYPIEWGANQAGMQAYSTTNALIDGKSPEEKWGEIIEQALTNAESFSSALYHKQIGNRIIENYSYIKLVLSATNLSNFFHQRIHHAAEPHIKDLAIAMFQAIENSKPDVLKKGEWHLPYLDTERDSDGVLYYFRKSDVARENPLSFNAAKYISIACCAQVSYRNLDDSSEKIMKVLSMLNMEGEPGHFSPYCHQATPMVRYNLDFGLPIEVGISHVTTKTRDFYSGQFKHWIQYRKTLENEYCDKFDKDDFEKRLKEIEEMKLLNSSVLN